MISQFDGFADEYKAPQFSVSVQGRSMNVTLQREQKPYPASGVLPEDQVANFTTSFTLVVTQRISEDDVLAVPIKMAK